MSRLGALGGQAAAAARRSQTARRLFLGRPGSYWLRRGLDVRRCRGGWFVAVETGAACLFREDCDDLGEVPQ